MTAPAAANPEKLGIHFNLQSLPVSPHSPQSPTQPNIPMNKSTIPTRITSVISQEEVRETSPTTTAAPPAEETIIFHPVSDYITPGYLNGSSCDFDE